MNSGRGRPLASFLHLTPSPHQTGLFPSISQLLSFVFSGLACRSMNVTALFQKTLRHHRDFLIQQPRDWRFTRPLGMSPPYKDSTTPSTILMSYFHLFGPNIRSHSTILLLLLYDPCASNLHLFHRPIFHSSLHKPHSLHNPQSALHPPKDCMLPV